MHDRDRGRRADGAPAATDPLSLLAGLRRDRPDAAYEPVARRHDFRSLLYDTPAGRRVLAQILERCGVLARSHVPGDPLETARREGMREIGLWLLAIMGDDGPEAAATALGDPADAAATPDRTSPQQ